MQSKWFVAGLALVGVLAAQPPLALKGLKGVRPDSSGVAVAGRRHFTARRHIMVQFRAPATPGELKILIDRGASILEYVPQYGYALSVPDRIQLSDLGLQWSGTLAAGQKMSPDLERHSASQTAYAVAAFYSDVPMEEARKIALEAHLQIHENPNLMDHDLLVYGPPGEFLALARWDEVAYVFPASEDLIQGRPVITCPGALTDQGQIGQAVAKVGGWGAPGASADLQYAFVNVTEKLAAAAAESEIVRALFEWSKYVKVNWSLTGDPSAARTVAILFDRLAHGDAYPFDGPGGVIAHTFYPYPVTSEPLAGNMHFDDDENWNVGTDVDLFSVALHETGHALGLGHSDNPGAVMYPYYHKATGLSAEDIAAIQTLYASQDDTGSVAPAPLMLTVVNPGATTTVSMLNLSGSTSGGAPPVTVTWETDTNLTGVASGSTHWTIQNIPLRPGANTISIVASDSQHASITKSLAIDFVNSPPVNVVPSVQITSPSSGGRYATTSSTVVLSGTASYTKGISRITWTTSSGVSGVASGTTVWNSGNIGLTSATTLIAVTAIGPDGLTATESFEVDYTAPNPTTPVDPIVPSGGPPNVTILDPAITTLTVSTASLAVRGTASSGLSISAVQWTTSNGDAGTASGTTQWSIPGIPLLIGTNTITIRAYDTSGLSAWRTLVVTRTEQD